MSHLPGQVGVADSVAWTCADATRPVAPPWRCRRRSAPSRTLAAEDAPPRGRSAAAPAARLRRFPPRRGVRPRIWTV